MSRHNVNFGNLQFNEFFVDRTKTKKQEIISHAFYLNKLVTFFQMADHPTFEKTKIKIIATTTTPTTNHQENHLSTLAPASTCTCLLRLVESWTCPELLEVLFI